MRLVFEDIDDQKPGVRALEITTLTTESSDRAIVYAIWTRNAQGSMPVDRAWSLLHQRYTDEVRFLFLHTYEELLAPRTPAWSPADFLAKLRRVLDSAGGRLNPEVRDLLVMADDDLHPLSDEDAARLERIRTRVSSRPGDPAAARKRLQRLASDVVRELHDRTTGDRALGDSRAKVPAAASESAWKTAVATAKGARTAYSASAKVAPGDVVLHPKFGAGVVLGVEPGRANILFESGARKLIAG